jgi:hypothetical protein
MMPWYCANRDHEHSTEWEADACSELYDRWQEALTYLMAYVREKEVKIQINSALQEMADADEEDERCR